MAVTDWIHNGGDAEWVTYPDCNPQSQSGRHWDTEETKHTRSCNTFGQVNTQTQKRTEESNGNQARGTQET